MRIPLKVALPLAFVVLQAYPQEPLTLHVDVLEEIHVTGDCRIYNKNTADKKPRYFRNPGICHQESQKHLTEAEDTLKDGVMARVTYEINESDYLVHNFTSHPVAFVLDQPLPEGWHVITDPQPIAINDHMATYRVLAQPGQTVRLHTGQRR
jgi:hypothetical protein